MKHYAVLVTDTGDVVWVGAADHVLQACSLASREANQNVGAFAPYTHSDQDDFDLKHLVLNVYDLSAFYERTTLAQLQANSAELDENRYVGTFAAGYED